MDVGTTLAQARRQRGLSVTDIAERTKVSSAVLRAIESGDLSKLPGGLYGRGFLRAYAREVGCDPEEIVRQYREACHEGDTATVADTAGPGELHVRDIDAIDRQRSRVQWIALAVVIVTIVGFSAPLVRSDNFARLVRALTAMHAPAATLAPAGVETKPLGPTDEKSPSRRSTDLQLDAQVTGPCWVTASADGKQLIYRLMQSGERTQIAARREITVRVGDPSHIALAINGEAVRPLGQAGQPTTRHITPENYQSLLEKPQPAN